MTNEKRRSRVKFRVAPTMVIIEGVYMQLNGLQTVIESLASHSESKIVLFTKLNSCKDLNIGFWLQLDPVFYEVKQDFMSFAGLPNIMDYSTV
jgi:hypothetical protein